MKTHMIGLALFGAIALSGCKDEVDTGVAEVNATPIANAGPDQVVPADVAVLLEGTASFDEDGDSLSYTWSFEFVPEGSALTVDSITPNGDGSASAPSFQPDVVGTYVLGLKVNDGKLWSDPDFVVIKTETPEDLPVANAGVDQVVDQGSSVCLDGSESYDPSGLPLTYYWGIVSLPELSDLESGDLTNADTSEMCFVADARGIYTFTLEVSNGLVTSLADAANVTAVGDNGEPIANAGEDKAGQDCTWHALNATGSVDPDGDSLKYFWEIQSKPSASAVHNDSSFNPDRYSPSPTFFADQAGVYVLSLTVFDGTNWSVPDILTLTIGERSFNSPPVVSIATPPTIDAGAACCEPSGYIYDCEECTTQTTSLGTGVTINDPDNDPYTILWEEVEGSVTFTDPTDLNTNLKLDDIEPSEPQVTDDNQFEIQLTVTDCTGEATVATVIQIATCTGADETDTGIDCVTEE